MYFCSGPKRHVGAHSYGRLPLTWSQLCMHTVQENAPLNTNHLSSKEFFDMHYISNTLAAYYVKRTVTE